MEQTPQSKPVLRGRFSIVAAVSLLALAAILYGHTADFPFQFDDDLYLVRNPLAGEVSNVRATADMRSFLDRARELMMDEDVAVNMIMRPFGYLTFALNYQLDGPSPRWFRVANIGIHGLNAVLAFLLISRLLRTGKEGESPTEGSMRLVPLSAAALFVAHPLQTEATTYIIQRFTSLGALFYLSCILLHLAAIEAGTKFKSRLLTAASVAALLLGMMTKECVVTAPLMLLTVHIVMLKRSFWQAIRRTAPHLLCMIIVPAKVLFVSQAKSPGSFGLLESMNIVNAADQPFTITTYLASQAPVVLGYLRLIFLPLGLNVDPDPLRAGSLLEWRVIGSGLVLALIFLCAWRVHRQRKDPRASLAFAGVILFFLALLPSSSLVPLPDLMAEHRAYLSSLGILLASVCWLDLLRARLQLCWPVHRLAFPAIAAAWVAALGAATVMRNETWRSHSALWSDAAAKSPQKWRAWSNLGAAHGVAGKLDEAERCMKKAISLNPRIGNSFVNLGSIYLMRKKYEEVLRLTDEALAHQPRCPSIRYNHAAALYNLGRMDECESRVSEIVRVMPAHARAQSLYGLILANHRSDPARAREHMLIAASLDRGDQLVRDWLAQLEAVLASRGTVATAAR